ncbi:MAG: DHH family phosphoesterase [Candidatus Woesearchaeota archaeon]
MDEEKISLLDENIAKIKEDVSSGNEFPEELLEIVNYSPEQAIILGHNQPDPDCIAMSAAMRHILRQNDIDSKIFYTGEVNNYMNKQLFTDLDLRNNLLFRVNDIVSSNKRSDLEDALKAIRHTVILDTQSPELQVNFFKYMNPKTFIDHHAHSNGSDSKDQDDVFNLVIPSGAGTSILLDYMRQKDYDLSASELSTLRILSYLGMKTDTNNFHRKRMTGLDHTALEYLIGFMNDDDYKSVEKISDPKLPPSVMGELGKALSFSSKNVYGGKVVIYPVPEIIESDTDTSLVPYLADELFERKKHLGADAVIVYGMVATESGKEKNVKVIASGRSIDSTIDVRTIFEEAFYSWKMEDESQDDDNIPIYSKKLSSGGRKTPEGATVAGATVSHPEYNQHVVLENIWPEISSMYKKRILEASGIKEE